MEDDSAGSTIGKIIAGRAAPIVHLSIAEDSTGRTATAHICTIDGVRNGVGIYRCTALREGAPVVSRLDGHERMRGLRGPSYSRPYELIGALLPLYVPRVSARKRQGEGRSGAATCLTELGLPRLRPAQAAERGFPARTARAIVGEDGRKRSTIIGRSDGLINVTTGVGSQYRSAGGGAVIDSQHILGIVGVTAHIDVGKE